MAMNPMVCSRTGHRHIIRAHPRSVFLRYHRIIRQLYVLLGLAQKPRLRGTCDSTIRVHLSFFSMLWLLLTIQTLSSWYWPICFSNSFVLLVFFFFIRLSTLSPILFGMLVLTNIAPPALTRRKPTPAQIGGFSCVL